ncbi:single-stranded DNA-binding protein [Microbispora sp. H11081]|uniref:single-stranded DNA-binding protein n=1 Tax=Microbispora sp. H11081 TaxID=2729107 RepID=UPI00147327CB|nr:single-stranded DNA-binding protein [Microbispora sp. H11081]
MHRNEVTLAGRLSMEPAHRELPSGALLTQWRLAVRRPGGRPGFQRSDAIECATFDDGVRDMLAEWRLDDLVEVEGALRRRWWRGGSRYEVEVRRAVRVEPAAVPAGRRRGRAHRTDDAASGDDSAIGDDSAKTAHAGHAAAALPETGPVEVLEVPDTREASASDEAGAASRDQDVAGSPEAAGETAVSRWRRSA